MRKAMVLAIFIGGMFIAGVASAPPASQAGTPASGDRALLAILLDVATALVRALIAVHQLTLKIELAFADASPMVSAVLGLIKCVSAIAILLGLMSFSTLQRAWQRWM